MLETLTSCYQEVRLAEEDTDSGCSTVASTLDNFSEELYGMESTPPEIFNIMEEYANEGREDENEFAVLLCSYSM